MIHLKPTIRHGLSCDEVQGEFDKKDPICKNQMTVKGLRDFLNVLIEAGYEDYSANFGYDSNVVYTYPSTCIKVKDKQLYILE